MKQHNGFMGCSICVHPGETKQHTDVYLPGTAYPLKIHSSIGIEAQEIGEAVNGIKERSSLESIVDLVNGIYALRIGRCNEEAPRYVDNIYEESLLHW